MRLTAAVMVTRVYRGGRSRLNTLTFNLEETPVAYRNSFTAQITAGTAQKIPSPWQSELLPETGAADTPAYCRGSNTAERLIQYQS